MATPSRRLRRKDAAFATPTAWLRDASRRCARPCHPPPELSRTPGRKAASPSLVLRGSVRIIAGLGARAQRFEGRDLAPQRRDDWRRLRTRLEPRRQTRALRYRLRRNPTAYLRQLEALALNQPLPP